MQKAYSRTYWENKPSDKSPIDQRNLNNIESGVDAIDDRVITLDTTKATKIEVSTLFDDISLDEQTGIITFTRKNGSTVSIDTPMEKIQTGIYYNPATEKLVLPLIDGTTIEVDLSRLMKFDEFIDSDTIAFSVKPNGTVTAIVKNGSIEEKHLQPNYLADIKIESGKAQTSAQNAAQSANEADYNAKLAQSYAVGGSGIRDNEDADNAKKYSEQSKANANVSQEYLTKVEKAGEDAVNAIKNALDIDAPNFEVDLSTGHLMYSGGRFVFNVNNDGHLEWGLAI